MRFLEPKGANVRAKHAALYAQYELAYTFVDFAAAGLFVVGSLLFFNESTANIATWMFLIGSICFGLKPAIRLVREIHLYRLGDYKALSDQVTTE